MNLKKVIDNTEEFYGENMHANSSREQVDARKSEIYGTLFEAAKATAGNIVSFLQERGINATVPHYQGLANKWGCSTDIVINDSSRLDIYVKGGPWAEYGETPTENDYRVEMNVSARGTFNIEDTSDDRAMYYRAVAVIISNASEFRKCFAPIAKAVWDTLKETHHLSSRHYELEREERNAAAEKERLEKIEKNKQMLEGADIALLRRGGTGVIYRGREYGLTAAGSEEDVRAARRDIPYRDHDDYLVANASSVRVNE